MGILAFGMFNIHSRCDITEGGVLGLTLLVYRWFGISPGITSFIVDGTLFCTGILFFGKRFLAGSLMASVCYSCWYLLFEHIGPAIPSLNDHLLIAAIAGAVFVGIGVGIVVRHSIAAGGDDALALIINKKYSIELKKVYITSDAVILLLSLSYINIRSIVFSLISVVISGYIIDQIHGIKIREYKL